MNDVPRILLLTAYYHPFQGGVETHAKELAGYLHENGIKVVIVTKKVDRTVPVIETIDGNPVYRITPGGQRTGIRKWLMIPFAVLKIIQLRSKFDIIYCPGYQGIGLAAIGAAMFLKRPVVLRSGNLGVLYCQNWDAPLNRLRIPPNNKFVTFMKGMFRKIYTSADAFVCNCREIEKEAIACNVPNSKIYYLPNAVDIRRYSMSSKDERKRIRREEGWKEDRFLCIYVGRLSMEKGVLDLLEAWSLVERKDKLLIIVGPDMTGNHMDVGPAVREFVKKHAMTDEVHIYGPSTNVPRLLRAADMFAQPSHYEAFSNSVIEAMASGLPIAATRVGGMLDCIVDGESGLLCRPKCPEDLAERIRRIINDPPLRDRLGMKARETVEKDFNKSIIFNRFIQLFIAKAKESKL